MRLSILLATITLALVGAGSAVSQTWRIGDDQTFPTDITTLPVQRQQAILTGLKPSLSKLAKEADMDSAEIAQAEKNLLVGEVSTLSGKLLLVQGSGSYLCGNAAGGNCTFWALGDHNRLLLAGRASELTILKSSRFGKPSILTSLHDSAWDSTLVWYRFDGSRYRASACATKSYFKRAFIDPHARPRIEYFPCKVYRNNPSG